MQKPGQWMTEPHISTVQENPWEVTHGNYLLPGEREVSQPKRLSIGRSLLAPATICS